MDNLKRKLCNFLIKNEMVKENDVIRHSYSTHRMNNFRKQSSDNNISPTLDTRCDCLGITVKGKDMNYQDYIKTELLILVPVLYFMGIQLKKKNS